MEDLINLRTGCGKGVVKTESLDGKKPDILQDIWEDKSQLACRGSTDLVVDVLHVELGDVMAAGQPESSAAQLSLQ